MTKEELIKHDGQEIIYKGYHGVLGLYKSDIFIFFDKENDDSRFLERTYPDLYKKYKKQNAKIIDLTRYNEITLDNFININHDWWWI